MAPMHFPVPETSENKTRLFLGVCFFFFIIPTFPEPQNEAPTFCDFWCIERFNRPYFEQVFIHCDTETSIFRMLSNYSK